MTPEREAEIRAAWVDGRYGPKWEVGFFCDAVDDLLEELDALRARIIRLNEELANVEAERDLMKHRITELEDELSQSRLDIHYLEGELQFERYYVDEGEKEG